MAPVLGSMLGHTVPPWPADDALPEDFWARIRAQYPLTFRRVYFNAGGLGPAPHAVLNAQRDTIDLCQRRSEAMYRFITEARPEVAAFIGALPQEVAFLRNATEGNATIASGLDLRGGDEVIFESHAHPGGSIPWMSRQKRDGIRVNVFEPDSQSEAGNLERIEALITPQTRVIQVSHITAPTGIRMPVEAIARMAKDRGIWFHVDGAQSAGMIPVDVKAIGCDSYATSGHKWLGAPHGTGLLYVREDRLDEVVPTDVGAYSDATYALPDTLTFHPSARRYESGTRDAAPVVGMLEAVRFMQRIGMERVAAHGFGLARYLADTFRAMEGVHVLSPEPAEMATSMTAFQVPGKSHEQIYRALREEYQFRCRIVSELGLNAIRVSTHVFNNATECERLAGVVGILARA